MASSRTQNSSSSSLALDSYHHPTAGGVHQEFQKTRAKRRTSGRVKPVAFNTGDDAPIPPPKTPNPPPTTTPIVQKSNQQHTNATMNDTMNESHNNPTQQEPTVSNNVTVQEGDIVFVDPLDESCKFWHPAMVVPRSEIDSSMGHFEGIEQPDQYLVRYFIDNSFSVVRAGELDKFSSSSRIFIDYENALGKEFTNDIGVGQALEYLKSNDVPEQFKWINWGRSGKYTTVKAPTPVTTTPVSMARTASKNGSNRSTRKATNNNNNNNNTQHHQVKREPSVSSATTTSTSTSAKPVSLKRQYSQASDNDSVTTTQTEQTTDSTIPPLPPTTTPMDLPPFLLSNDGTRITPKEHSKRCKLTEDNIRTAQSQLLSMSKLVGQLSRNKTKQTYEYAEKLRQLVLQSQSLRHDIQTNVGNVLFGGADLSEPLINRYKSQYDQYYVDGDDCGNNNNNNNNGGGGDDNKGVRASKRRKVPSKRRQQ